MRRYIRKCINRLYLKLWLYYTDTIINIIKDNEESVLAIKIKHNKQHVLTLYKELYKENKK